MSNPTKIILAGIAFIFIALGAGLYFVKQYNTINAPIIEEPTSHESSSPSTSAPEEPKLVYGTSSWSEAYAIFPQPSAPSTPPIIPDEKTITENPDGTKNTEITRPDFSKPEPPPPPKMDESQASDPTKEPEYTEEQLKPNQPTTPETPSGGGTTGGGTTDKPTTPDTPTGGETNNKGQVYVPGFGWITPSVGKSEVLENAGTGDVIGY